MLTAARNLSTAASLLGLGGRGLQSVPESFQDLPATEKTQLRVLHAQIGMQPAELFASTTNLAGCMKHYLGAEIEALDTKV